MFGPLAEKLGKHGDKLNDRMMEIRDRLGEIAGNTEAQLKRSQWTRRSVPVTVGKQGELRNTSACGWVIKRVAATAGVEIFLGTATDESFVCALTARTSEEVNWYIPEGGIIFVKNTEEGEEGLDGFANFEIELLISGARKGSTGKSEEHIDVPRRPGQVPSGDPLDDPVAA